VKGADLFALLPNGWKRCPLKHTCDFAVSNVDKLTLEDELSVRLCNYTDVYKNERVSPDMELMMATATPQEIERFHLEAGDVVITKDSESWSDIGIAAYVERTADDFVCGYHLALIRPRKEVLDGRFLLRCIQARPVALQLELEATGVTRYGLPKDAIGLAVLPLPPLPSQHLIANYLDRETARIDKLIAEKERMLALLDQKRSALISRVVTRGLDPNAPLKPSGLEWLGEIPGDWGLWRLKHLASEALLYGANEAALEDNQDWPRFIRITDIGENGALKDETFKSLSPDVAEPFLLIDGDLLLARSGATVGKSFIYRQSWGAACFAGYLIRFRCDFAKALPDYLYLFAQSSAYWHQVSTGMIQATIQNFSAEKYGEIVVPLPPVKVQEKIVATLARTQTRFDSLTQEIRRSVAFLKERRAALISSAVTGLIPLEVMAR